MDEHISEFVGAWSVDPGSDGGEGRDLTERSQLCRAGRVAAALTGPPVKGGAGRLGLVAGDPELGTGVQHTPLGLERGDAARVCAPRTMS